MAEFNLFLGTARKSVGDITLYRRNGRQVARVRVRDIGNPKSEAQSETRNFLAPVIKFYAPLRKALARSFEGCSKDRSYNEFQRANIRMARANQWFLPKGTPFTPLPYQLSRGSLKPLTYTITSGATEPNIVWTIPGLTMSRGTIGELSASLIADGAHMGDVVTLVVVFKTAAGDYYPYSTQFYVNPSNVASIDTIGGDLFELTWDGDDIMPAGLTESIHAFAVILTRPSASGWLRSTQYLAVDPAIIALLTSADQKAATIASYGPTSSEGGGSVYPDDAGEPFNCQTISGRALLFYGGQYNAVTLEERAQKYIMLKPANLDEYFYVKDSYGNFLGTNSAGSLAVSDWRYVSLVAQQATAINTISAAPGTTFAAYLQSIGFTLIQ